MNQIRVAAYARVSSKEQAEKELSIPAQLKAIRKYCQDNGWKLVAEYLDEGRSAKTADRPAFQKMIAIAKKQTRHFDAIVVYKFDRFSRSREDHVVYKALLKKHGVTVFSVTEQTDSDTPHGFLLEGMLEVISGFYNMNLANETKKGMFENARRGFHNGGTAPFGYRNYRYDHNGTIKTIWVLGPDDEVATVKRIFQLYVYEGFGYKKIAGLLNEEGIPCPSNEKWSYSTIWHILHNEAYLGYRTWNKQDYQTPGQKWKPKDQWIVIKEAHPAIINEEIFDLVKERAKVRNRCLSPFKAQGSSFILRGLFKCPRCGAFMVSGQGSSGGKYRNVRRYYVCGAYQRKGRTVCTFQAFKKELTENLVIDALMREFTLLCLPGVLEEEIKREADAKNREANLRLHEIQQDKEFTQRRVEMLERDIGKTPDAKQLTDYIYELKTNLNKLETEEKEITSSLLNVNLSSSTIETVRYQLQEYIRNIKALPPDNQWLLLRKYIHEINFELTSNMFKIDIVIPNVEPDSDPILQKTCFVKYERS